MSSCSQPLGWAGEHGDPPPADVQGVRFARMRGSTKKVWALVLAVSVSLAAAAGASDDPAVDCFSEDIERRIEGCTALIERGELSLVNPSHVYAMRALAFSLKGRY